MQIEKHRLVRGESRFNVQFRESPNRGGALKPRFLVMHYTAGMGAGGAITWLCDPQAKASAHFVIDRVTGAVTQLVDGNRVAWHAGQSEWNGLQGLNQFSIGIELDNAGKLRREGGKWVNWAKRVVPDEEVVELTHKHETSPTGWHTYSAIQIEAALEVALALHAAYGFEDILGHEDISCGRKTDPGPAFPLSSFAARVLGRR